jgi:mannosyltransferase
VHSLAAALLLEPAELHHFADFGYEHEPFRYCPFMPPNGQNPDVIKTTEEERPLMGCRCHCDGNLLSIHPTCLNRIKYAI